jgi:L-ascorbate metabolism protein UlaG (beta-lactamase superfamily)
VTVTAVPAQHGPDAVLEIVGPVTGFILEAGGGRPVYVSGDTIRFAGTAEIARRFAPVAAALLHIGRARVQPLGALDLSLSGEEAALYARELGARAIVPIHYEGWHHFTEGRDEAEPAFAKAGLADRVRWLDRGGSVEIDLS